MLILLVLQQLTKYFVRTKFNYKTISYKFCISKINKTELTLILLTVIV